MKRYVSASTTDEMLDAFEAKLDQLKGVKSACNVKSAEDIKCEDEVIEVSWYNDEEEDTEGWIKIERKLVNDFDGFATDYTLWYNEITDEWCTVFGDNDLYHPWDSTHDMDFENNEAEARDWFYDYNTDDTFD